MQMCILPILIAALLTVGAHPPVGSSPPTPQEAVVAFGAGVTRGAVFERSIAPALNFRLIPFGEDWEVWVGDSADGSIILLK